MLDGSDRVGLTQTQGTNRDTEKVLVNGQLQIRRPDGNCYTATGMLARRKQSEPNKTK